MDDVLALSLQFVGIEPAALCTLMRQHGQAAVQAKQAGDRRTMRRQTAFFHAAQRRLAVVFGETHGWTLSPRSFGLRTLGEGKQHGSYQFNDTPGGNPDPVCFGEYFDHPYFYRRDRKAVAIAAHLYGYPHNRDQCSP